MAEQILESGGIRGEWEYLENLAGVGHKTASVVMSQWYGFPAPLIPISIDLLKDGDSQKGKNVEMTERDLKKIWPRKLWNKLHLQIIFFGREFCPARNHNLEKCRICSWAASKKVIREEMKK